MQLGTEEFKNYFPMLRSVAQRTPLVYLDSAATALKPQVVIDTISNFYQKEYATVHRAVYAAAQAATDSYEASRQKVARFINATSSDEIVFTRGTTTSLNLVAHSLSALCLREGDEIVITEMEHHSNIVPWQMIRDRYRAQLKVVPFLDTGELDMDAFLKMVTPRCKIAAFTHMSNALGTINPIKEMIAAVHAIGAYVVLDAAQSIAHIPIDVQDLDADFIAFSGHKMYGPTGIGVLYGKKDLLAAMPPFEGGGDMIETVTFEKTTYNTPPIKFEAGTPIIASAIGLGAAVDFINSIGLQAISAYESELYRYLEDKLLQIEGLTLFGRAPHKGSLATFVIKNTHPLDVATLIDLKGVSIRSGHLCAQPVMRHFGITGALRASLACYNTKDDIDRFIEALVLCKECLSC